MYVHRTLTNDRALAKKGLQKIFDHELKALADPKVQEEFLAHSGTLLSDDSLPLYLQITLFSFRRNLSEETSAFLQASLTQKMFVFNTIAST